MVNSLENNVRAKRAIVLLLMVALCGAFVLGGMMRIGSWLIVSDPLSRADVIVVLSGHMPYRAMEAASIYNQGWAFEIWLTRPLDSVTQAAMVRLGIKVVSEQDYNREVLERLGVPPKKIHALGVGIQNTEQEVLLIARELKRTGGKNVILVTSKPHTRRVRSIWQGLVGNSPRAIVRYAAEDPYDADHWWRNTRDALAVSREVFGLINAWSGFPVRPYREKPKENTSRPSLELLSQAFA